MLLVFSSPFIEERLYLIKGEIIMSIKKKFSSPFIEERLYFKKPLGTMITIILVLVPFYRGAVVF